MLSIVKGKDAGGGGLFGDLLMKISMIHQKMLGSFVLKLSVVWRVKGFQPALAC